MNPSQVPEKPLTAGINNTIEKSQPIYFFEREDGTVFHTSSQDAWNVYVGRNRVIGPGRPRHKYIGVSNGELFQQAVHNSQTVFKTEGLQAAQEILRRGIDSELELARNNKTPPPNTDTVLGNTGQHVNLSKLR